MQNQILSILSPFYQLLITNNYVIIFLIVFIFAFFFDYLSKFYSGDFFLSFISFHIFNVHFRNEILPFLYALPFVIIISKFSNSISSLFLIIIFWICIQWILSIIYNKIGPIFVAIFKQNEHSILASELGIKTLNWFLDIFLTLEFLKFLSVNLATQSGFTQLNNLYGLAIVSYTALYQFSVFLFDQKQKNIFEKINYIENQIEKYDYSDIYSKIQNEPFRRIYNSNFPLLSNEVMIISPRSSNEIKAITPLKSLLSKDLYMNFSPPILYRPSSILNFLLGFKMKNEEILNHLLSIFFKNNCVLTDLNFNNLDFRSLSSLLIFKNTSLKLRFKNGNVVDSYFYHVKFLFLLVIESFFYRCHFNDSYFNSIDFDKNAFHDCQISNTDFVVCRFMDTKFYNSWFNDKTVFRESNFNSNEFFQVQFQQSMFLNTSISHSKLVDSKFEASGFFGVRFYNSEIKGCKFRNSFFNSENLSLNLVKDGFCAPTEFPNNFDPIANGLIDISQFKKKTQEKIIEILRKGRYSSSLSKKLTSIISI